jgi:F-type H+-transporting ATPase subunit a
MDISIVLNGETLVSAGVVNSMIIVMVLSVFFVLCSMTIKKANPAEPSTGIVLVLEFFVTSVENVCRTIMNDQKGRFAPFIGMLIIYLVIANLLGLLGLVAPTSNYTVTLSLAMFAISYLTIAGIQTKGLLAYLKDTFLGVAPFLLPLNIIGELSKILSLSLRLFGNILGGSMVTFVLIRLFGWFITPIMPALNFYFDIFAGLLQTMIFCFLLMIWLGDVAAIEE